MSSDKPLKINIGFHGGGVLAARVSAAELAKLREVLGKAGGWHQLAGEDAMVTLDLTRIDYLLVENDEHRIGF